MSWRYTLLWATVLAAGVARADGPGDNLPAKVRAVPPEGIKLDATDGAALQAGLDELGKEIEDLRQALKDKPALVELLPDVQIYHKAVRYALVYHEFHQPREVAAAKKLLEQGLERAAQLRGGNAPWNTATGLVVRGYVSKIDGSVQPYGLVVPASYQPKGPAQYRLDFWFHGRGETLSEVNFITGRQSSPGEFVPRDSFVLHPYGRYCNANKFAGEIDLFEALEHAKKHYPIDENRLIVRGFSMGGASCWQFAVHYPGLWAAAAPGAGFSETPDFLKVFQNETLEPAWYEKQLWHLYDCTDYAVNLFNCPTVAYSGENDRQKQAADMMAKALAAEGMELVHVIGRKAGHQYTAEARAEINRRIDQIASLGRDALAVEVHFTTWTLRYNRCQFLEIDGLEKHWERARADVDLVGGADGGPVIETANISAFTISLPSGRFGLPLDVSRRRHILIDGQDVQAPGPLSDRSWVAHFRKNRSNWKPAGPPEDGALRKQHGLQGPIDDAFMDSFVMVRPTGAPMNEKTGKWAAAELQHAVDHWRRQFRGDARVLDDTAVGDAEIAAHNLILWGDPRSNAILTRIADKLPVKWNDRGVHIGPKSFDAGHHVPVLIFPNPLNPKRYVVLNSGFTFREYDYLNNARQVPKLPDYAVIDVDVPVSARAPGSIAAAGFFTESWGLPAGDQ
jgi:pimeloyl-ACP methyl ester carboxylesterase